MAEAGKSVMTPERVRMAIQSRFNPIRDLTPDVLSNRLDAWSRGLLRGMALTMELIEDRDDVIRSVAPKRKKAVARHGWEVLTIDDSPEAARHKEALEYFYNNLVATHATDLDMRGGTKLLVRQMMDAVGKKYAVHEIIWKPTRDGMLTAELRFVPLWFFESTTGKLRFLRADYDLYGVDLESGGWMVTCGDGIMTACAVAYMFKALPLKDWLIYSERFGMPGIKGTTSAARGSDEWNAMVEAVQAFGQNFAAVMSAGESIEPIDMKGNGQAPHAALVERMDRAIATLWRGGDLSTMSKGNQAVGSNAQAGESELLDQDDSEMIAETLQTQLDRMVIHYLFGDETEPLAYFTLRSAAPKATELDIKVDNFLLQNGAPMGVSDVMERYGRTMPDEDDELLTGGGSVTRSRGDAEGKTNPEENLANAATTDHGPQDDGVFARAIATDLQPLRKRLERVLQIEDPELLKSKLAALKAELPQLLKDINADPEGGKVLAGLVGEAMAKGLAGEEISRGVAETRSGLANAFEAGQPRDSLGKWVDGNGGGMTEDDNIQRGQKAVDRALRQKRDVQKAMYRKEVGQIDFVWGTPGKKEPNASGQTYTGGFGISHILAKHGEAGARELPQTLAKGKIKHHEDDTSKMVAEHGDYRALLVKANSRKAWVLTGYDRRQVSK